MCGSFPALRAHPHKHTHTHLMHTGVHVYDTTISFIRILRLMNIRIAVASSSKNCKQILERAGLYVPMGAWTRLSCGPMFACAHIPLFCWMDRLHTHMRIHMYTHKHTHTHAHTRTCSHAHAHAPAHTPEHLAHLRTMHSPSNYHTPTNTYQIWGSSSRL